MSCRGSTYCGGTVEMVTFGCSLGAYHAMSFALKRAEKFPLAMCFSGTYDPTFWNAGMSGHGSVLQHVGHLHGEHLDWPRLPGQRPARSRRDY